MHIVGEQAQPCPIPKQNLQERGVLATKGEQMTAEGVLLELLLDQRRKSVQTFSHVGVTERQVHLHARRNDDHDAFSFAASCRFTAAGLLPAGANTRRPSSSSIAVMPSGGRTRSRSAASAGSSSAAPSANVTVANCGAFRAVRPNSARQRNSMLVAMPWRRQTSATAIPGFSVSCTIARFCSSLKRRRFDRPSAAGGVKRYLRRTELAALLNCARHSDEAGIASPLRRRILPGDRAICAARR